MAGISGIVQLLQCFNGLICGLHNLPVHHWGIIWSAHMDGIDSAAGKGSDLVYHAGIVLHQKRTGGHPFFFPFFDLLIENLGQAFLPGSWKCLHGLSNGHPFQGGDIYATSLFATEPASFVTGSLFFEFSDDLVKGYIYLAQFWYFVFYINDLFAVLRAILKYFHWFPRQPLWTKPHEE